MEIKERLNDEEMKTFEASLKDKRDWKNALDTALDEGREKGRREGITLMAEKLLKKGMSTQEISEITSLSEEEISTIAKRLKIDKK